MTASLAIADKVFKEKPSHVAIEVAKVVSETSSQKHA